MHIHLNSGNDIEKLAQMVAVILSSGGMASLSVTRCKSITSPPMVTCKIDGVSKLSNVELTIEGIRVWRAYGVGPGKLISAPKAKIPSPDTLPSMVVYSWRTQALSPPSWKGGLPQHIQVKPMPLETRRKPTKSLQLQTRHCLHAQKKDVVRHSWGTPTWCKA